MEIAETKKDKTIILHVKGRADTNASPDFEAALMDAIARAQGPLILDLSDLDYIASAGLRVILMGAKKVKADDGKMLLCGLRDNIKKVFEISGFMSIFTITGTVEEALAQT